VSHRTLLRRNLKVAPAQPATAFWRAIELGHLLMSRSLPPEGRGVDLGCGDGAITELIRDAMGARWDLVGVDPDPRELALAAGRGLYEQLAQAEGSALPAADGAFDFVFSNSVLEHVPSLEPTLAEVGRVLKAGGAFVFTVPSEFFPQNLGSPGFLGAFVTGSRDSQAYRREIDRRLQHLRYWSLDQWRSALTGAGLEILEASYYMSRRETRRWAALSNATAGLLVRVMGRGARPIEIQRRLGLRRRDPPIWLRVLGRSICELSLVGLGRHEGQDEQGSCLLIVARKTGTTFSEAVDLVHGLAPPGIEGVTMSFSLPRWSSVPPPARYTMPPIAPDRSSDPRNRSANARARSWLAP
jgi:SAM-dependent methyltransferase